MMGPMMNRAAISAELLVDAHTTLGEGPVWDDGERCLWWVDIMGKTGTAERAPNPDQAWYVGVAPFNDPRIVVAATIERGGFGVDTAAPVVQQILADYLDVKPGPPATNPALTTTE